MRKRLIASVFITFLFVAPVFAGHVNAGGGWCECGSFAACICDPGENGGGNRANVPGDSKPNDLGTEALLVLAVLILMLRYKA